MHVQATVGERKRHSTALHCLWKHLPGIPLGLVDLQRTYAPFNWLQQSTAK